MESIPLEIRLARDYARLHDEFSSHPLLDFVHVSPRIKRELREIFIKRNKADQTKSLPMAFDYEKYAQVINYFDEEEDLSDLEKEDFTYLMNSYLNEVEVEWNQAVYQSCFEHLTPFVKTLKELEPQNPLLLSALFDINGEPRGFDYRRTRELMELSAKETQELWSREGIMEYTYLLVNYVNVLAEEVFKINKRNESDLISLLELFKEKKSSGQQ